VGHREDLLAGAKLCLYERGYARTSARDIVAASGANLASIGYHFGSKDGLLFAAMQAAMTDWADEFRAAVRGAVVRGGSLAERLEGVVGGLVGTLGTHRALWVATFEVFPQLERSPELRRQIAAAYEDGRRGLAALLLGVAEDDVDEEDVRTVGALFFVLISGVIAQWFVDPRRAPNADQLVLGMRAMLAVS
jgi:AcrR family transcriptional regulator